MTMRMPSEILELSQLTTEPHGRGLRPRNITPTPSGRETVVTEVLETEQVKRSIFKTKFGYFVRVRKAKLC